MPRIPLVEQVPFFQTTLLPLLRCKHLLCDRNEVFLHSRTSYNLVQPFYFLPVNSTKSEIALMDFSPPALTKETSLNASVLFLLSSIVNLRFHIFLLLLQNQHGPPSLFEQQLAFQTHGADVRENQVLFHRGTFSIRLLYENQNQSVSLQGKPEVPFPHC